MARVQYMVLAQTIGLEAWYLKLQGKPENSKQSESKYFFEKQRLLKRFLYRQRVFYNIIIVFMLLFIKVERSSKQSKCWIKYNLKQD